MSFSVRAGAGAALLGCLLLLAACSGVAPTPDELGSASPAQLEDASDFVGEWEYRWGDSPRAADGTLRWAAPPPLATGDAGAIDPGWQPLGRRMIPQPPGRAGRRFLWLRARLSGPKVPDPTLYIGPLNQLFEAFIDGHLLYRWGQLDGNGAGERRFRGLPMHLIPLGDSYQGRMLTLRIYSQHIVIGVGSQLRIGTKVGIVRDLLRNDVGKAMVGMVLCAVGLFVLGLYLTERKERAYLYYSGFAFAIGVWLLCQMRTRHLIIGAPLVLTYVEFFSLYIGAACLVRFLVLVLGRGPLGLMPMVSRIFMGYVVVAALLVATGVIGIMSTIAIFEIGLLPVIVYMTIAVGIQVRQGNSDARLFAAGFLTAILLGAYDVLSTLGVLPRLSTGLSHFGQGFFVIALGLILVRRFRLIHADLIKTKQALSEKVQALQGRNTEIEHLNQELRHQIEARSKQLISSLSDTREVAPLLAEGELLNERYRIVRVLGRGAMGVVYEVERVHDSRRFAAKVLAGRAHRRELARFAREAQLLARLKHDNLVSIADVDVTSTGLAYLIMELIVGTTLEAQSARYTELNFVLPVLQQLADALAKVHAEGVVHRDLKPSNIMVAPMDGGARPVIKVVDFGVSALLESEADQRASQRIVVHQGDNKTTATAAQNAITVDGLPGLFAAAYIPAPGESARTSWKGSTRGDILTETGVIMGTPLYMAPELIRGAQLARPASDMFSYGVLAYEVLTGHLPAETPPMLLRLKPFLRWYTPLSVPCPSLPASLCSLIERCLDVTPEIRPTASELAAALRDWLAKGSPTRP